jgi:hypothetical protein
MGGGEVRMQSGLQHSRDSISNRIRYHEQGNKETFDPG